MRANRKSLMVTVRLAVVFFAAAGALAAGCGGDGGGDEQVTPTPATGGGGGSGGAAGKGGSGGSGVAGSILGGVGGGLPDSCKTDSECKGFKCCGGECIDTKFDIAHCGMCGNKCPGADAQTATCKDGVCNACAAGKADCNALPIDGCEATLDTDAKNCGKCGQACLLANADSSKCAASKCVIEACKTGFLDCDKKGENGCEVDSSNDAGNCGTCGMACPSIPNATPKCELGKCGKFTCKAGFADCNGDAKDGCEIDLTKDTANCGKCGEKCDDVPNGKAACSDGVCGVGSCNAGFDNCDQSSGNGCETDLSSDVNHCAACGQKCTDPESGTAACAESKCSTGKCNPGYDDCDPVKPGCETNLAIAIENCGFCGYKCPDIANGKPKCELFACGIGQCNEGFKHCIGGEENGCETDIFNDSLNCGDCNQPCPAVANGSGQCELGKCVVTSCDGTFDDCNGDASDGCEANKVSDPANCGACGNGCTNPPQGTAKCDGGQCVVGSCDVGFADCGAAPGCETPTDADPLNCGGCNIICPSGACDSGKCICSKKVLLIADDSPAGATPLINAMTAAGLTVVVAKDNGVEVPVWNYKNVPPLVSGEYGAVVVLAGGPTVNQNQNASITDMPPEGQQAIVDFVKASNGLVLTEWAALHATSGRWQGLKDYILLDRTLSFSGQVTYAVEPAFANHPLWAGLPPSFKFSSTSNVGLVRLGNGNKRVAGSPEALDAVAIRDEPLQGRVVHVAHAGNYTDSGWANANITQLVANAANWAARCK